MRLKRTLVQTLMEEEATDYRTNAYDRTLSSYAFGYEMFGIGNGGGGNNSSGFGSAGQSSSLGSAGNLTIRDLPSSGVQLHIHEGENGTAHLRTYDRKKIGISSYDAAMMDLLANKLKLPKLKR